MDYVNDAVEKFRKLIIEQLQRCEKMKNSGEPKDFRKMDRITIGIIDGDGIGPIIMKEAKRVLCNLLDDEITCGKVVLEDIEGLTLENRMEKGQAVPVDVLEKIKKCDVLLKGPTTTPKGGTLESANVALRRELDLYANVRPVVVPEENIDWIFYRENTEGEYVLGSRGVELPGELAMDFKVTTDLGTRRIAKAAFDYAVANGKTKVAVVTKANIMKKTDGNFSKICHQVAENYEGIEVEDWYIDIMTANLVNKEIRNQFQVFLLPNLYGDIITDEAAEIQGGVGTAGSANIGDKYAMFEAIHGSAPRLIEEGKGDYANPSSILKATAMMLRHIGYIDKATVLEKALDESEIGNMTCNQFSDMIINKIKG